MGITINNRSISISNNLIVIIVRIVVDTLIIKVINSTHHPPNSSSMINNHMIIAVVVEVENHSIGIKVASINISKKMRITTTPHQISMLINNSNRGLKEVAITNQDNLRATIISHSSLSNSTVESNNLSLAN